MLKWFKNGSRANVSKDCPKEVLDALECLTDKIIKEFDPTNIEGDNYKCPYCKRESPCKGAYPEGCFYDNHKPKTI